MNLNLPCINKCITQKSIIKGFGKVTVLKKADETDAVEANKNKAMLSAADDSKCCSNTTRFLYFEM